MKNLKIVLVSIVSLFIASTAFASDMTVSCNFAVDNGGLTPGNTSSMIAGEHLSNGIWTANVSGAESPVSVEFDGAAYAYDIHGVLVKVVGSDWSLSGDTNNSATKSGSDFQASRQQVIVTAIDDTGTASVSCPEFFVYTKLTSNSCTVPVSTAVVGQTVKWSSNYSGGNAPYTFTWSGDQNISSLTSAIASIAYTTGGDKNASVTKIISGDNQTWTGNTSCNGPVSVLDDSISGGGSEVPAPIGNVSCTVSSTNVNVGDTVIWTAHVTGGIAPFSLNWSGTESLAGGATSTSITYTTTGTKTATFNTVLDSVGQSKTVSISCPSVTVNALPNGGGSNTGGTHSSGSPVTSCSNRKMGDITCDGNIDLSDFNALMVSWGSTSANNPADLNKDGAVDLLDFNLLMVNWIG